MTQDDWARDPQTLLKVLKFQDELMRKRKREEESKKEIQLDPDESGTPIQLLGPTRAPKLSSPRERQSIIDRVRNFPDLVKSPRGKSKEKEVVRDKASHRRRTLSLGHNMSSAVSKAKSNLDNPPPIPEKPRLSRTNSQTTPALTKDTVAPPPLPVKPKKKLASSAEGSNASKISASLDRPPVPKKPETQQVEKLEIPKPSTSPKSSPRSPPRSSTPLPPLSIEPALRPGVPQLSLGAGTMDEKQLQEQFGVKKDTIADIHKALGKPHHSITFDHPPNYQQKQTKKTSEILYNSLLFYVTVFIFQFSKKRNL
jgi:hypothetical protein